MDNLEQEYLKGRELGNPRIKFCQYNWTGTRKIVLPQSFRPKKLEKIIIYIGIS